MKYSSFLLLSFISLSIVSMESGWKPWNTNPIWNRTQFAKQRFFERAFTFLQEAPARYQKMREDVQEDPEFFNRNIFRQCSNYDVKQLENIWEECGQFPTTPVLKSILKKYGRIVPEDQNCDEGAWLIAQHANHDEAFQQKVLIQLGKLKSPTALVQYAFLLDRILLNRGEPQHFGTQLDKQGLLAPINGYFPTHPEALLQLEVVNQRREAAGLLPLEESDEYKSHLINSIALSTGAELALPS